MRAAAVFSSHMVLQREKPICVWGKAADGEEITAELCGQTVKTTAQAGVWKLYFSPMNAAEQCTMTIRGASETIELTDISIGEVWLCGGQSNMEFEVHNDLHGEQLLAGLSAESRVRFYYTPKQRMKDADFDAVERNTCWMPASPENARAWSAVGLYFALALQKNSA